MPISAVDLFCGIGGLTHGLQLSGIPAILMTTHDFATLPRYADQVALIDHRIIRMGQPVEILNSPEFKNVFHMTGGAQV